MLSGREKKLMISAITSLLPTSSGGLSGLSGGSSTLGASGFGPDFLLNVLGRRTSVSGGTAYDANGRPITENENSERMKFRKQALESAKTLLKVGDTAGAREAAESVLKRDSSDAIAAAYVGRTYLAEGNYDEAKRYFTRAASGSDSDQIQADLRTATILAKGPDAALAEIKRLLRQPATQREGAQIAAYLLDAEPGNVDTRIELVNFYEKLGQKALAGAELSDAIAATPVEKFDALLRRIEQFNADYSQDAGSFDLLAQAYVRIGRLGDAQDAFSSAIALSKENLEFQGQIKADYAKTFVTLAREAKTEGREDEARRLYRKSLDISSNETTKAEYSDFEFERGERDLQAGRLRLALEAFDNARAYQPGSVSEEKKADLIKAYERLATKAGDAADLKTVVDARYGAFILDPGNDTRKRGLANAHDTYGLSLYDQGDYRGALRQFHSAIQYYTTDPNYAAHYALAQSRL
ncbi:MAG: tetratricopeptide repeat protein [Planctomycetes bacterium]|nr:tetratricopeptide repeat protein [Planctomycetota bacterium]